MNLQNKRVLVTGGAGAIGSNVVRTLQERGARVHVLDDLSSGKSCDIPSGVEFTFASILDSDAEDLVRESNVVIHLAAKFANQNSIEHPVDDLMVNAVGTLELLENARHVERFVYASTSCVTQLRTPYAISKLTGEQYVRFYGEQFGVPVNVVRYFNSYGPFDYPGQYRSVIPNWLATAMMGKPLPVLGDVQATRDFTFVKDIAEATVRAAECDGTGHVMELGTGQSTTLATLANVVNLITGNKGGVSLNDRRSWDTVHDRRADPSLARTVLGYAPSTPLEAGLAETFAWMQTLADVQRR